RLRSSARRRWRRYAWGRASVPASRLDYSLALLLLVEPFDDEFLEQRLVAGVAQRGERPQPFERELVKAHGDRRGAARTDELLHAQGLFAAALLREELLRIVELQFRGGVERGLGLRFFLGGRGHLDPFGGEEPWYLLHVYHRDTCLCPTIVAPGTGMVALATTPEGPAPRASPEPRPWSAPAGGRWHRGSDQSDPVIERQ